MSVTNPARPEPGALAPGQVTTLASGHVAPHGACGSSAASSATCVTGQHQPRDHRGRDARSGRVGEPDGGRGRQSLLSTPGKRRPTMTCSTNRSRRSRRRSRRSCSWSAPRARHRSCRIRRTRSRCPRRSCRHRPAGGGSRVPTGSARWFPGRGRRPRRRTPRPGGHHGHLDREDSGAVRGEQDRDGGTWPALSARGKDAQVQHDHAGIKTNLSIWLMLASVPCAAWLPMARAGPPATSAVDRRPTAVEHPRAAAN